MLSLAQCRELLGAGHALDDEHLGRMRDALYGIAELVCDDVKSTSLMFEKAKRLAPREDWDRIGERAAIYEHEAELSRDVAERLAIRDYLRDEVEP
jgi:hypothetical protein